MIVTLFIDNNPNDSGYIALNSFGHIMPNCTAY